MAYISISSARKLQAGNEFTVNGSDPVRIFGENCDTYKIKDGKYHVVFRSANGEAWECDADLNVRRASSARMHVRLAVDNEGNITDMEYAVTYLTTQQEGAYFVFPKLKLSYPAVKPADTVVDPDFAPDLPAEDPEAVSERAPSGNSRKKGGTGWIIFGVISLVTAVANASQLPTLLGCGILGLICLIVGIRKKKS